MPYFYSILKSISKDSGKQGFFIIKKNPDIWNNKKGAWNDLIWLNLYSDSCQIAIVEWH